MKRFILMSMLLWSVMAASAQETVNVTFTANTEIGLYCPFTAVSATNVTKGWTEMLYYPDTVLVMTTTDGIDEYTNECTDFLLGDANPNPFTDETHVLLEMKESYEVLIQIVRIDGAVSAFRKLRLTAGVHRVTVVLAQPQMAFLVVTTAHGRQVTKLVNTGYRSHNIIALETLSMEMRASTDCVRGNAMGEFEPGDVMRYVALLEDGETTVYSEAVMQEQYVDETIELSFALWQPTVNTSSVIDITQTSATCGGEVTYDGGINVIERGVCWSSSENPTINDYHTSNGTGMGGFTSNITGLTPETTYYVRAYATNILGTTYGMQQQFITAPVSLPTVTTDTVSNVTQTTATCGGEVISDGGANVTARGVCWRTSPNPTINNGHTYNGSGTGMFTSNLSNLVPGTTYYVRAYATNSAGTAYGMERQFTSAPPTILPTVTTNLVSNVMPRTATCGGNVTDAGGGTIFARGVCWSTSQDPALNNSHTIDGSGTGEFISNITGLIPGMTYYVRAYATNSAGTAYGAQQEFTTPMPSTPTGAINNGFFSVSEARLVWFSQGNLQYRASTNTWRFATNQWDFVGGTDISSGTSHGNVSGSSNNNISPTYSGWIDLFGWGTSDYNHGAVCYQPWSTSLNNSDYFAYGSPYSNLYDETGQADWGYNAISNGGGQNHQWSTLTSEEWGYVCNTRSTPSGIRYAFAIVNYAQGGYVQGVILLPDNWSADYYDLNDINVHTNGVNNIISSSSWINSLQAHGAIFLPIAGVREGIDYQEYIAEYWAAGGSGPSYAESFCLSIMLNNHVAERHYGIPVRLVKDVE